jgi:hypothetical protein
MAAVASDELTKRQVEALRAWRKATDVAERSNRDLLQYGAGIAALLGISAGSSGVFSVAESLQGAESGGSPWWALAILAIVLVVAFVASGVMAALLVQAYSRRESAEGDADAALSELIGLDPEHFWPKAE